MAPTARATEPYDQRPVKGSGCAEGFPAIKSHAAPAASPSPSDGTQGSCHCRLTRSSQPCSVGRGTGGGSNLAPRQILTPDQWPNRRRAQVLHAQAAIKSIANTPKVRARQTCARVLTSMTSPMPMASQTICAAVSRALRRFCNCGIRSASAT